MCFPLGFYWRPKKSKLLNKCGLLGNLALVLKKFSCGETGNFNTWPMVPEDNSFRFCIVKILGDGSFFK